MDELLEMKLKLASLEERLYKLEHPKSMVQRLFFTEGNGKAKKQQPIEKVEPKKEEIRPAQLSDVM